MRRDGGAGAAGGPDRFSSEGELIGKPRSLAGQLNGRYDGARTLSMNNTPSVLIARDHPERIDAPLPLQRRLEHPAVAGAALLMSVKSMNNVGEPVFAMTHSSEMRSGRD